MDNQFRTKKPKLEDYLIRYSENKTLLKKQGDVFSIPKIADFYNDIQEFKGHYLFSIDESAYFLDESKVFDAHPVNFEFVVNRSFRTLPNRLERLGGATAAHLAHWESLNQFCGRCGTTMNYGTTERSLVCPHCKNTVYPRISPVVIVAVENGNELLMAKNLDNPNPRLFLISGFVEIGESLEQAASREVFEETGIHIKNIKYFGSQPWPFSDALIAGFTAELDGKSDIKIDTNELATALWVHRNDIPPYETDVSISCCLIEKFRRQ